MTDPIPDMWQGEFAATRQIGARLFGVQKFAFTHALLADLSFNGMFYNYSSRYCYEKKLDALMAMTEWDGKDDPPGPWIKEKVSERFGPGALGE